MGFFDRLNDDQARDLVNVIYNYAGEVGKREEAAERRHRELLDTIGSIVGAVAVGLRATADALERGSRRR